MAPGIFGGGGLTPEQRALRHAREILTRWKPPKRGRGRPPGRKHPRTTGGLSGRPDPWRELPPWAPFALLAEAWMELERRHPGQQITWTRALRVMTEPHWQLRDADKPLMNALRRVFRGWRDREKTLQNRYLDRKKKDDGQALVVARIVLAQNRPEALAIFDRVFGTVSEPCRQTPLASH